MMFQIVMDTFSERPCALAMDDEHLPKSADDGIVKELADHLFRFVDHESAHIDFTMQVRRLLQKCARSPATFLAACGERLFSSPLDEATVARLNIRLETAELHLDVRALDLEHRRLLVEIPHIDDVANGKLLHVDLLFVRLARNQPRS